MGTLRRRCAPVPQPSELPFAVVLAVGRGIAVLDGGQRSPTGRGRFGGFLFSIFTTGNAIGLPTVKRFRFVREKLTFPFGKHIVRKLDSCAFWRYIRFQHPSRGL